MMNGATSDEWTNATVLSENAESIVGEPRRAASRAYIDDDAMEYTACGHLLSDAGILLRREMNFLTASHQYILCRDINDC